MQYENRLIVYIDVLGFKQVIARTLNTNGETGLEVKSICEMFSLIREHWHVGGSANISQFSDLIVISVVPDLEGELVAHKEAPAIRTKYEWMKKKYNEAATLAQPGTWYKQLPVNV